MRNQSSRMKTFSSRLGDAVLTIWALVGGISILLVILGFSMNVSIMMFRTGSMEPTIPTGSIALVREIPATDISEGDIVTVDRGDELLPITHRVTEILEVDDTTDEVTFVMRGDANETDDPEPYTAMTVQRAMFSIPAVAPFIQSLQSPFVLGGLTLGATVLVVWAFWPRDPEAAPAPRKRQGAHAAHGLALPIVVALMIPLLPGQSVTTEEVAGEYIRLQSFGDRSKMTNMAPGQPVTWAVDVWVDAPEPGLVDLELSAVGQLAAHPDAMTTEVVLCTPHPTDVTECHPDQGLERKVVDVSDLVDEDSEQFLGSMRSDETRRVLVTATLTDAAPESLQSATASFRFSASGYNEQLTASPSPVDPTAGTTPLENSGDLADTGFNALWAAALAVTAIIIGCLLVIRGIGKARSHGKDGGTPIV